MKKRKINPLIPMGAITGTPSKQDIDEMLDFYKSVDIEQFLIYPRSGCEIEYLSDKWFETCGYIIKKASELNMKIYLYDDFNWPSGQCNGSIVAENTSFAQKQLSVKFENGSAIAKIINMGLLYEENEDEILPLSNLLDPNVTKEIISKTHDEYYKRFGEYFGNTIIGIFTDEPTYIYRCADNLPYFNEAPSEYKIIHDRDLFEDISAITDENSYKQFIDRYFDMIGQRFVYSYFNVITKWCEEHKIMSTGHLYNETTGQKANGNILKAISSLTLPGMDEINTITDYDSFESITFCVFEYAARKKKCGLAELFALGPGDMKLSTIRKMLGISSLFGVNNYVLAVAAFDARGNMYKDDYFNPHGYMQPWNEAYKQLGIEAKLMSEYSSKTPISHIELVYPISELRKNIYDQKETDSINSYVYNTINKAEKLQYNISIIDEADKPNAPVVLYYNDKISEADIEGIIKRKAYITDENGAILDDILLKTYDDGFAAVDMRATGEMRNVIINYNESKYSASIWPGDFICDKGVYIQENKKVISEYNAKEFELKTEKQNLMRIFRIDDTFKFTADDNIEDVVFLIRSYKADNTEIYIDGCKINAINRKNQLIKGFSDLYLVSEPMLIKKGEHTVTYNGEALERRYLPISFMCGNFALNNNYHISKFPKIVYSDSSLDFLQNYTGKITLQTKIKIPVCDDSLYIDVNTYGLYTRVTINNEESQERLWEPFIYKIPDYTKGTEVDLKIDIFTSVRPMFGDFTEFNKTYYRSPWVDESFDGNALNEIGVSNLKIVAVNEKTTKIK